MAKLDAAERKALPKSDFAGPARSFPVEDKNHARDALGRAKQGLNAGRISRAVYDKIVAKADKKLGEK